MKRIIDVDVVIEKYNTENPNLKQLNRRILAEKLGVNIQVFSDWKNGRTPKIIYRLLTLMKIANCQFEDFIVQK